MTALTDRTWYQSDQRISFWRFPLLLLTPLFVAVPIAFGLRIVYGYGWYPVVFAPIIAGLLVAGAVYLAVGWSHCRNRWLAGAIGAMAGAATYLGFYYLCMLDVLPPGNAHRVDLLPDYVVARMQTDVIGDFGRPNNRPHKPFVPLNWGTFLFELALCISFPAATAWNRARWAYCSEFRQWLTREIAQFPPFAGEELRDKFANGELERVVALYGLRKSETAEGAKAKASKNNANTACRLTLEYLSVPDRSALTYPVYMSIDDQRQHRRWYQARFSRTMLVRQIGLSTDEVLTLCPMFPSLAATLTAQHDELRNVVSVPVQGNAALATEVATIAPVPARFSRRVRSKGYAAKVNLLGLIPVAFLFGGMGLVGLGVYLFEAGRIGLSVAPLALGAASAAWGLYAALFCLSVYENRWIERRLRRELASRPDFIVNPHDPDSLYVSLIPREHFSKIRLTMSTDLLLMKIDDVDGAILLEGDCDRYQIPSGSIVECEAECFYHLLDSQQRNQLWMLRLLICTESGVRELLLAVNRWNFWPHSNSTRRAMAVEISRRIQALSEPIFDE